MNESRSHPCVIVGLGHGARADYIVREVRIGDPVDLGLEADRYDPLNVAAYHSGHLIGYIAPGWRWVAHSLEQGNRHAVTVTGFEYDTRDELSAITIGIEVFAPEPDMEVVDEMPARPAPGTAPWAPRIVHAPLPRWPLIIPLGLLAAALAVGTWFLVDRGYLPQLGQLASGQ
jgi:hypothetical protein